MIELRKTMLVTRETLALIIIVYLAMLSLPSYKNQSLKTSLPLSVRLLRGSQRTSWPRSPREGKKMFWTRCPWPKEKDIPPTLHNVYVP